MRGKRFYNSGWFMWLTLIFFAPVGIFLMWKNKRFNKPVRSILSIFFAIIFISAAVSGNSTTNTKTTNDKEIVSSEKVDVEDTTKEEIPKENKDRKDIEDNTAEVGQDNSTNTENNEVKDEVDAKDTEKNNTTLNNNGNTNTSVNGKLEVHYIDVGQADSILIQQNGQNMLIDAGNNADGNLVVNYLKNQGISKLDYVIGTHPHEDHIGGLDVVIKTFSVGKVYMPKASATTATYKDVLSAISNKGLKILAPTVGSTINLGDAKATILAPNGTNYEDANNHSIVIRLAYGNNSFLFMGDAEDVSEGQILSKGFNVKADVLKVGHHGSSSSTTQAFLNKVSPKYAVITAGKDNSYGHPHKPVMDRLKAKGIAVYRTDESGTIVATSDGNKISFSKGPESYSYNGSGSSASGGTSNPVKTTPAPNTNPPQNTAPTPSNNDNTKALIKGNINSKGEKIYHVPGGAFYDRTDPEEWFRTEAEAKAAGYRKSMR